MENISTSLQVTEHSSSLCSSNFTRLVLPVLCGLVFFMGIPGNLLSLWVFAKKMQVRTPTHVYLINLCVSNLLLCATLPMRAAYYAAGDGWSARRPLCRAVVGGVTPILHVDIYVGVLILTWIALTRVAALVQPSRGGRPGACARALPVALFHRLRDVRFARTVCLVVWALVLASVVPVVAFYTAIETVSGDSSGQAGNGSAEACYSLAVEVGGNFSQLTNMAAVLLFYLCFLLVLASYVAVGRHVARARRNTALPDRRGIYGRVFRNITVIQLVLAICLLPYHIFRPAFVGLARHWAAQQPAAGADCHPMSWHVETKNALLLLTAFRSTTDPVMCFLLDNKFRRHVVDLVSLRCGKLSGRRTSGPERTRTSPIEMAETCTEKPTKTDFSEDFTF